MTFLDAGAPRSRGERVPIRSARSAEIKRTRSHSRGCAVLGGRWYLGRLEVFTTHATIREPR